MHWPRSLRSWIAALQGACLLCITPLTGTIDGFNSPPLRVGHTGHPLQAPLFAAYDQAAGTEASARVSLQLRRFQAGGDVGYALLAGELDAGFVEPGKALELLKRDTRRPLRVLGALTFPYGATLVLRKDLKLRLGELGAARVGVASEDCALLHQLREDGRRLEADLSKLRLRPLPFDAMVPALEARAVDAVLVKGAYAAVATQLGHKVIYQNWEVKTGDACCPPIVTQAEFVLLVSADNPDCERLDQALRAASRLPAGVLRQAVRNHTAYTSGALGDLPVAAFESLPPELHRQLEPASPSATTQAENPTS